MPAIVIENYQNYQAYTKISPLEFGLFESLSHIAWSISLSYIIFACVHDSGGPVNWLLSLPMWQPISKLSYAIYLIHCAILGITGLTFQTPPSFSEQTALLHGISVFVLSAFVSIPLVLAFEFPIDAIYKLTMDKSKKIAVISSPKKPIEQLTENYDSIKL